MRLKFWDIKHVVTVEGTCIEVIFRLDNFDDIVAALLFCRFGMTMFLILSWLITRRIRIGCANLVIILFFQEVVLNSRKELPTTLSLFKR